MDIAALFVFIRNSAAVINAAKSAEFADEIVPAAFFLNPFVGWVESLSMKKSKRSI